MQKESQSQISELLEQAEEFIRQGNREKAYQSGLKATSIFPNDPSAWYLRSRNAPSHEERLMCLSRAYALDTKGSETKTELRNAIQELLQKEPFLAYVYETEELYQVRSGRDLLVNIPKNRTYETPYLKRNRGPVIAAYRWLHLSLLGLLLGGVGAILFAPVAVFQTLRLQTTSLSQADRVRSWVILIFSGLIWLISIPISWLFLIRFFSG